MGKNLILIEPLEEVRKEPLFHAKKKDLFQKLEILGYSVLYLDETWEQSSSIILSFFRTAMSRSLEIIAFPSYQRLLPELVQAVQNSLSRLLSQPNVNEATINHFGRTWTHNYLKNWNLNKNRPIPAGYLPEKCFYKKTLLFLGASPELEEQVERIQKISTHCITLASDTAVQFLLKQGIRVDMILSMDPGRGTLYHFLPKVPDHIPIITWLGGSTYLFSLPNPICILNTGYPMDQILEFKLSTHWPLFKNPSLNLIGTAKALAEWTQASNLVIAGVSFLAKNGKSHCRGTGYESFRIPNILRKKTWEDLHHTQLYKNDSLKHQKAKQVLEETNGSLDPAIIPIQNLGTESFSSESNQTEGIHILPFQGFPEIDKADWNQAFQQVPGVVCRESFLKFFSV